MMAPEKVLPTNSMSLSTKISYGFGHIFNDLCASMWFSYLLVFFGKVLLFSPNDAGVILLVGQLADGFSTPLVGILSDKENKIPSCAKYGRRKIWHLVGTLLVLISFPFVFSTAFGIEFGNTYLEITYYSFFVVVFQFGWASVQISHLSLIPELTSKKHSRTELNSIRYAFTVLSNLSMYVIAFLFLGISADGSDERVSSNATSTTQYDTSTKINDNIDNFITPDDDTEFRNMAIFAICAGSFFSLMFHIGVEEPPFKKPCMEISCSEEVEKKEISPVHPQRMRLIDWFKEIAFYQIAILYMATRLYVNLYQVYIPLYVQDTLQLSKTAIATVPFVIYLSGFVGSLVMKQMNRKIGRKVTYIIGTLIGLMGCIMVNFGESDSYRTWGIYCVAALLGIGGSTVLITSLSITADLIGCNVEGGAFVYGFMSFVDKISNGVVIMVIQSLYNSNIYFYQNVITYACGASCILGLLTSISLLPIKVNERRGLSNSIATLIEDGIEKSSSNVLDSYNQEKSLQPMQTISNINLDLPIKQH